MFGLSIDTVHDLQSIFKQFSNINEVLIFGSRAKGNYKNGADIDLAIKGQNITFDELMDVSLKIDELELLYKVDILNYYQKKNLPIGRHIDRVGKSFYKKN